MAAAGDPRLGAVPGGGVRGARGDRGPGGPLHQPRGAGPPSPRLRVGRERRARSASARRAIRRGVAAACLGGLSVIELRPCTNDADYEAWLAVRRSVLPNER